MGCSSEDVDFPVDGIFTLNKKRNYSMVNRLVENESKPWLRWIFILLASWFVPIGILIVVTLNNGLYIRYYEATSYGPKLRVPGNQIRGLRYTCMDPKEDGRPIYSIYFKSLLTENNRLGIFKTGLHKAVKVRGLELEFYHHTTSASKPAYSPIVPEYITTDLQEITNSVNSLIYVKNGWRINIDLGNVSEVLVNDFSYKVFQDGESFFAIKSKKAIASYKLSELVLRGHVSIITANGSTLECNHAEWDTKKEYFNIVGTYVLSRNNEKSMGRDICVDTQLNPVKTQQAKINQKEAQRCFAKMP